MTTQEELAVRLKQLGIRVTPQRLAIAEVVINSGDHPSVKDVFERVKEFFPYVTLATVYATLDLLERAAIVRELPFQRQSRYDANLSPHANLVCISCRGDPRRDGRLNPPSAPPPVRWRAGFQYLFLQLTQSGRPRSSNLATKGAGRMAG